MATSVLVIADPESARPLRRTLAAAGHEVVLASSMAAARRAAKRRGISVVVLDPRLPDGQGLELIPELREHLQRAPVIVLVDDRDPMAALVAMRDGAFDCLPAPVDPERLRNRIDDALRLTPAQAIAVPHVPEGERAAGLVGGSPVMREVFKKLGLLAASRATVLIRGESGTGKELAARVLHDYGTGSTGAPFVAVHCAALPAQLIEAELFGHRRGAFTGAERDKPGKLELAGEGTLFLDEVGEIPLDMQVKLLRVLQERQLERIGDDLPRPFRARVIAATHRDLEAMVRQRTFREDLYYRLAVATVTLPPLRDRREDIPQIAERLLAEVTQDVRRRVDGLSVAALEALCAHEWPGNVRQLRNILTHAVVRCRGRLVDVEDLSLRQEGQGSAGVGPGFQQARGTDRFPTLVEAERDLVRRALERAGGHRGRACALLGVSRPTLLRKLRKYGLISADALDGDLDLEEGDEERDVPESPSGGMGRTGRGS